MHWKSFSPLIQCQVETRILTCCECPAYLFPQIITESNCSLGVFWKRFACLFLQPSFITSLRSLAVLHYIVLKNICEESEVARLCMFCWCFTQFHQDLGWLSCSRSPTFRHFDDHLVIRVSPDYSASMCRFWDTICHRCFFPYDRMRALVTGISNPMAALRRSSSSSSAPTWLRKGFLVFDSLDLGGLICLLICLINSIFGLAIDDERFCFHNWICPLR